MQFRRRSTCLLLIFTLFASTHALTNTSGVRYRCYVDVCDWTQYCSHQSTRCEHCSDRATECFTPAQDANCTLFCMKRAPCPALAQLNNGSHTGSDREQYLYQEKVTFECQAGYHNTGVRETVCLDYGRWSHQNLTLRQPNCEVNVCAIPRPPDHVTVEIPPNSTRFQVGSRITYGCQDGYRYLGGNPNRTCLLNGTWDGIPPQCIVNSCKSPESPVNGGMVSPARMEHFNVGTAITLTCNDGFDLEGQSTRRCLRNGLWDGLTPVCTVHKRKTDYRTIVLVIFLGVSVILNVILIIMCRKSKQNTSRDARKEDGPPESENLTALEDADKDNGTDRNSVTEGDHVIDLQKDRVESLKGTPTVKALSPRSDPTDERVDPDPDLITFNTKEGQHSNTDEGRHIFNINNLIIGHQNQVNTKVVGSAESHIDMDAQSQNDTFETESCCSHQTTTDAIEETGGRVTLPIDDPENETKIADDSGEERCNLIAQEINCDIDNIDETQL